VIFSHEKFLNVQSSSPLVKLRFVPGYCRPNAQKKIPVGGKFLVTSWQDVEINTLEQASTFPDSETEKWKYHPHK